MIRPPHDRDNSDDADRAPSYPRYDGHHSDGYAHDRDPFGLAEMVRTGLLDVVPGEPPVPINVLRVTDARGGPPRRPDRLTPRLATALVYLFTRPGDTVVDLTANRALAAATTAARCHYRPVSHLRDLDHVTGVAAPADRQANHRNRRVRKHRPGPVRLALLAWPLPARLRATALTAGPAVAGEVLAACRRLLAAGGCAVVVVAPNPARAPYVEHSRLVIPAAGRAGLGYLQHLIAVTEPGTAPTSTPTSGRADPSAGDTQPIEDDPATPDRLDPYLNLLVFTPRAGQR